MQGSRKTTCRAYHQDKRLNMIKMGLGRRLPNQKSLEWVEHKTGNLTLCSIFPHSNAPSHSLWECPGLCVSACVLRAGAHVSMLTYTRRSRRATLMLFLRCCPLYFYFKCMRVLLHVCICGHHVFYSAWGGQRGIGSSETTYRQLWVTSQIRILCESTVVSFLLSPFSFVTGCLVGLKLVR